MFVGRVHAVEAPDIEARTFRFAVRVIKICQALAERPGARRTLAAQLLRSGTSVGANVAEAQAAQSRLDFVSKLNIALKESRETLYWLRLLAEADLIEPARLGPITTEADEISRTLGAIVRTCRRSRT